MAPLLFALALLAQDAAGAPPSDGPMATAVPRKQDVAALPIQGGAVTAPADDYGYVGWCYGAISAYVELYDRAMPEVTRIERAWPTPGTEENISKIYPEQRDEAKRDLLLFASAMQAAEKASPSPIQPQGADAIRRGRAVWTGATSVPKAQLAQFWMSWSPPARCAATAKTLEARSMLFGQALSYNAAPVVAPAPPPVESPAETPMAAMTVEAPAEAASAPVAAPEPEAAPAPIATPEVKADEAPVAGANMVIARPLPSEDPEVELQGDDTVGPTAPIIDAAALSAGAPEPIAPAEAPTDPAPTAIDDLLPVATPPSDAPAAAETPAPVEAAPAPPAPAPTAPVRKRKRGLKETLTGLRGAQ